MKNSKLKIYWESAGTFLVRKEDSKYFIYLIFKRWSEDNKGWVPPKGKIEEGESKEEAAIRETKEETGIQDIRIIDFLGKDNFEFEDKKRDQIVEKTTYWYLAETNQQSGIKNLGEEEVQTQLNEKWFALDEAEEFLKYENEKALLRLAKEKLKI